MIKLLKLFFLPPLAIARLGASSTPLECFRWQEDPVSFGGAKTAIEPDITFDVCEDGSIAPYLPSIIRFKDGGLIRPLAPFLELWAIVERKRGTKLQEIEEPVTPTLLEELHIELRAVRYDVEAANLKAARRTDDPACGFIARREWGADDFQTHELLASSPAIAGSVPLVSAEWPIPLGFVQSIRPRESQDMGVNLATLRIRFTPAAGNVYGPPSADDAADATGTHPAQVHEVVPPADRILNELSAWTSYSDTSDGYDHPSPGDTYDGSDQGSEVSFGVVDDTCDAIVRASFTTNDGALHEAIARVSCAPPDFAPDRRPFVSLGDELAAREGPPPVDGSDDDRLLTKEEIADLFERAYETVSLLNLDAVRLGAVDPDSGDNQEDDPDMKQTSGTPLTNDGSMTKKDKSLIDKAAAAMLAASTAGDPLPYATFAEQTHSDIRDLDSIIDYLVQNDEHVREIIRPPYGPFRKLAATAPSRPASGHRDPRLLRDRLKDMRMPPYMRDSDAGALSLTRRQYRHLMNFLRAVKAGKVARPVDDHINRAVRRLKK